MSEESKVTTRRQKHKAPSTTPTNKKKKKPKVQSAPTVALFRDWQAFLVARREKFIAEGQYASRNSLTQWCAGMLVQNQHGDLFMIHELLEEKKVRLEMIPSIEALKAETGSVVKPKFKLVKRVSVGFLYSEKTGHLQRSCGSAALLPDPTDGVTG